MEKQDGGIGRHTAPPRTTRTDRKIQTSRRGGDGQPGGEDSRCVAVEGPRLAECGMNRAGSLTTSRPCSPTFMQINREGRTQSGGERGRQSGG